MNFCREVVVKGKNIELEFLKWMPVEGCKTIFLKSDQECQVDGETRLFYPIAVFCNPVITDKMLATCLREMADELDMGFID